MAGFARTRSLRCDCGGGASLPVARLQLDRGRLARAARETHSGPHIRNRRNASAVMTMPAARIRILVFFIRDPYAALNCKCCLNLTPHRMVRTARADGLYGFSYSLAKAKLKFSIHAAYAAVVEVVDDQ